jgi:hypothetical protein
MRPIGTVPPKVCARRDCRKKIGSLIFGGSAADGRHGLPRLPSQVLRDGAESFAAARVQSWWQFFERRLVARRLESPLIFLNGQGRHVGNFSTSWGRALRRAKASFAFHDLRRTAIRNMIRAGVPERVAMEISGHRTRAIFDRYNIVSGRDLDDAMAKRAAYEAEISLPGRHPERPARQPAVTGKGSHDHILDRGGHRRAYHSGAAESLATARRHRASLGSTVQGPSTDPFLLAYTCRKSLRTVKPAGGYRPTAHVVSTVSAGVTGERGSSVWQERNPPRYHVGDPFQHGRQTPSIAQARQQRSPWL